MPDGKLKQAAEAYFTDLRLVRSSGGATDERSLYVPLANLLNAVGGALRPKVFCVQDLANQGAGHPDFGLYTTRQVQKGKAKPGQKPERGVIEVKPVADDAWLTAASDQVTNYWQEYRQVLATNLRDFVLVGEDDCGNLVRLESFRLAGSAAEFDAKLARPRTFANEVGPGLVEYLTRVLSHAAALVEPKDPPPGWRGTAAWRPTLGTGGAGPVAGFLGMDQVDGRDALGAVDIPDAAALTSLREALEGSLGVGRPGTLATNRRPASAKAWRVPPSP